MDNIAGTKSSLTWAVHISVAALVRCGSFPTLGLLVSSFRTTDQIRSSGWWAAMFPAVQNETFRTADPDETRVDLGEGRFMVEGNLYVVDGNGSRPPRTCRRRFPSGACPRARSTPTRPATPPTWAMARR
jgi:alpha-glucoside transport system permease protein